MTKRIDRCIVAALLVSLTATAPAQTDETTTEPPDPCEQPEIQQFDFWVGEWDLEWGDGKTGTNVIKKDLDGCVVVERFNGAPSSPLNGMSVSSYNVERDQWQQTWVDNQGGYLDFAGEFTDGRMVLARDAVRDGKRFKQRMVWYDIKRDSLKWNWERSTDGGNTWEVLWKIEYRRANRSDDR